MSHRWKLFIAVAVVMLALMGVWIATMSLMPSNDVEAYKKMLIEKGEKLKISEVTPPSVPPEQNGVDIVNEAFGLLTSVGLDQSNMPPVMRMVAPGKAMVSFNLPDVRDRGYTNSWTNVILAVEAGHPAAELLKQAMNYPTIDFHLDYDKWPETSMTQLVPLRHCIQQLSFEAACDLHEGDAGSAATNICAALSLINGLRDERLLISQLVRIAMTQIVANPTWECLQSTNLNDAELAMLQTSWSKLGFVHAMENAFLMERAGNELMIKKMRESTGYSSHMIDDLVGGAGGSMDFWDSAKFTGAKFMWRVSWSYSDELRMLQNDQVALEAMRAIETNGFFNPAYTNMVNKLHANDPTNYPNSWMSKLDDKGLQRIFSEDALNTGGVLGRAMALEAAREIIITAIALKRYQLKHGDYPTSLDALVPEFLLSVPLDPVDGKPLRYHPHADGTYLLYSIGTNGKDDGGNPSLEPGFTGFSVLYWLNAHSLDWVWPQPATKTEIEYFYAHPPK